MAEIVRGCTDDLDDSGGERNATTWQARKEAYVAHIKDADSGTLVVSAADKLVNCLAITRDFRHVGDAVWDRFNVGRDGTLWYYADGLGPAFGRALQRFPDHPVLSRLILDFQRAAAELASEARR